MVESRSLVVRPCTPPAPLSGRGRPVRISDILDAETGTVLGAVYRLVPAPAWRRWLSPTTLSVHEADDEPLVFTLRASWPFARWWEVADADGHVVGTLHPPGSVRSDRPGRYGVIHGRHGQAIAVWRAEPDGLHSFRDPAGTELAREGPAAGGRGLTFAEQADSDPFTRMLLLAAVVQAGNG